MRTKITEIYFCDHCNKLYQKKHSCISHENLCKRNPENIPACYSCLFCEMAHEKHDVNIYYEDFGIDRIEQKNFSVLKCSKLGIYLKPILSDKRDRKIKELDLSQVVTPLACNEHKTRQDVTL